MINGQSFIRLALIAATITLNEGCVTKFASSEDFGPLSEIIAKSSTAEEIRGVWRSRGYGWLFDISDDGITQYQILGDTCFETPETAKGVTETLSIEYRYYRIAPSGEEAILQLLPEDTQIRAYRLDKLPPQCTSTKTWSYAEILDYYIDVIGAEYAFFERRDIDWATRAATARSELPSVVDETSYFDLLASMIDGFGDSHTKLIGSVDGIRRQQQDGLGETLPFIRGQDAETPWLVGIFRALQKDVLDPGSKHVANDRILWGLIDNRIGYIQILTMGGFSGVDIGDSQFREAEFAAFDAVLDEALSAMKDTDAVIVDLSNNRGGYDAISRRLASRFAAAPFAAYTTRTPSSGLPARTRIVKPSNTAAVFTGPVYLLTSDVTVSGGEIATLSMRQLPNVTHVGRATRGSFSTVLSKPLPNGWVVELSNEVFAAPDGTVHEESGISPEVEFAVFTKEDPIGGHAIAIERIVDLID